MVKLLSGGPSPRINETSPFIRLPRATLLDIISHFGLSQIYDALRQCELLCRVSLRCSDRKTIFTDYNKTVTYACVGPQPSTNSKTVHDRPPFMAALPHNHFKNLVWMMKHAERCFRSFADHHDISHLNHAKRLVPIKTFSYSMDHLSNFSAEFFSEIAFGTNVFLRCNTDKDFSMSISQVYLKGRSEYHVHDEVIA